MTQNPNYYNLHNISHQHLSDHLSELVDTTLNDLLNSKCIAIEDKMDVLPLNLSMIAAYYNISHVTVNIYTLSLKEKTKLKGLLEVVLSSAEFEVVPIRRGEESLLRKVYDRVPVKLDAVSVNFEAPHFKTFLLLQAHFSCISLPPDLVADTLVLSKVLNLLSACVDVMSSNAWLSALGAMDLAQMYVQGVWDRLMTRLSLIGIGFPRLARNQHRQMPTEVKNKVCLMYVLFILHYNACLLIT